VTRREQLKKALKNSEDGLTIVELSNITRMTSANVWSELQGRTGQVAWAYVDRWIESPCFDSYAAIWCYCEKATPHCPRPDCDDEIKTPKAGHKFCRCCGEEKPLEDFYFNHQQSGSRESTCKPCRLEKKKEYRRNNREKADENKHRYIETRRQRNIEARAQT
jgi:hypothetical protein